MSNRLVLCVVLCLLFSSGYCDFLFKILSYINWSRFYYAPVIQRIGWEQRIAYLNNASAIDQERQQHSPTSLNTKGRRHTTKVKRALISVQTAADSGDDDELMDARPLLMSREILRSIPRFKRTTGKEAQKMSSKSMVTSSPTTALATALKSSETTAGSNYNDYNYDEPESTKAGNLSTTTRAPQVHKLMAANGSSQPGSQQGADKEKKILRILNPIDEKDIDNLWVYVPYQISIKKRIIPPGVVTKSTAFIHFCGGTLITVTAILTAARCFHPGHWFEVVYLAHRDLGEKRAGKFWAVGGSENSHGVQDQEINTLARPDMEQWKQLKSVLIHPLHYGIFHDIAVAHVETEFMMTKRVRIVPMPWSTRFTDYDQYCLVSGYGCTYSNSRLTMGMIETIPAKECDKIHGANMRRYICAEDTVATICRGDPGGPLRCWGNRDPADEGRGVIAGIACSFDDENGTRKTLFTRIGKYSRKFIDLAVKMDARIVTCNRSLITFLLTLLVFNQ